MHNDGLEVTRTERDGLIGLVRLSDVIDENDNPRETQDNLSTMVVEHRGYSLGDGDMREVLGWNFDDARDTGRTVSAEVLERYVRLFYGVPREPDGFVWLGLLDHSGLHLYAGGGGHRSDPGNWDSGTVGFAFVGREAIEKTGAPLETVRDQMLAEIKEYDAYLRGEVYQVQIIDNENDEILETFHGFVGDERGAVEAMKEELDRWAEDRKEGARKDYERFQPSLLGEEG